MKQIGHDGVILNVAEGGIVLTHGSEDTMLAQLRWGEPDRDGADIQIEHDLLCCTKPGMVPVEPACCAEGGMTCKGKLFSCGEDADANAAVVFDLGIAGKDEGGLG